MRLALKLCTGALLWLPLIAGCPPGDDDDDGGNWPPTATSVVIEPAAPEAGEALTVFLTAEAWDADGDEVTYRIAWSLDGVLQEAWTSPTIDPGVTSGGQTWRVMVTPTDGRLDGPASSDSVVVGAAMDDDTGDDDSGDDDAGDDDAGDDDGGDDDTEWPVDPWGHTQSAWIDASGGAQGGPADVLMSWTIYDDLQNEICEIQWAYESTYTHGPAQGPDLWQHIDELLVWDAGVEAASSCPVGFEELFGADPEVLFTWIYHPMAFVSCEQVDLDPNLHALWLGDDVFGMTNGGTFGDWCEEVAPQMQATLGSGPMEGIWLMGGAEGLLDGVGNFSYFAPDDTTNVEAWMLLSLMMAEQSNPNEPVEGLVGEYFTVPIWMWLF